jgi:rRNA biogenesis protein RRP5
VTGLTPHGIFVSFYNGLKGLVPTREIPLPQGAPLEGTYATGQVIKCTVIGRDPGKGLRLSLSSSSATQSSTLPSAKLASLSDVSVGQVVTNATVTAVVPSESDPDSLASCALAIPSPAGGAPVNAMLHVEHLSDHPHGRDLLARTLRPGCIIPRCLVLSLHPGASPPHALVTLKHEMISAAARGALPCAFADLKVGMHVPGYIASVTDGACFVRFGGLLTARAGLNRLADEFVGSADALYSAGQSVLTIVEEVKAETQQATVSLKPSVACGVNARFLATLFRCDPP